MSQEMTKVFLSAELREKLQFIFRTIGSGPEKLKLAPFTSESAKFVPLSVLEQLFDPAEVQSLLLSHETETVQKLAPILSLDEQREVSAKMYRHFVGPQFRDKITANTLTNHETEPLFPVNFSIFDSFATAVTLGITGGFLAKCRTLPFEKIVLWATGGFMFGLILDMSIYMLKYKKGTLELKSRRSSRPFIKPPQSSKKHD